MKRLLLVLLFVPVMLQAQWLQSGDDIDGEGPDDEFGTSVSLNAVGDRVVVGAQYASVVGLGSAGHVKVYENDGSAWTQVGNTIDATAISVNIGWQVSFNDAGTIFATSSYFANNFVGMVAVYEELNGTWTQIGSNIEGIGSFDLFGTSVRMNASGTRFVASAIDQVRVYENMGGTWTQIGTDILPESPDENMISVDINNSGDRIIVGANQNDDIANNSGQVRVYEFIEGSWIQMGSDINGGAEFDGLGSQVCFNSDGSRFITGSSAEYVEIYEFMNGDWNQVGLRINGEQLVGFFGLALDMNGDGSLVVVGASNNDAGNGNSGANFGSSSVYREINGSWSQLGEDIDGEAFQDLSGNAVSINETGNIIAIGAMWNDGNGNKSGHVRLYNESTLLLESQNFERFKLYPNPSHDFVTIDFPVGSETYNIQIFDVLGKRVKQLDANQHQSFKMNVNDLPAGLYLVHINSKLMNTTMKLLVE
ncbi:T9SS type A sorting domain-containing protein [uncultured Psychroserpens sp.]|uniref:T9SS type A sorting domain-containing protein n=1 Tax=uncultured Psychroserpens sp. TaxID=255436 RepID=UPI002615487E|nr:T9SS type A sorting domain-containing protein [uncultured Psychroserpens sp.]